VCVCVCNTHTHTHIITIKKATIKKATPTGT
jgi:hypothetical protein